MFAVTPPCPGHESGHHSPTTVPPSRMTNTVTATANGPNEAVPPGDSGPGPGRHRRRQAEHSGDQGPPRGRMAWPCGPSRGRAGSDRSRSGRVDRPDHPSTMSAISDRLVRDGVGGGLVRDLLVLGDVAVRIRSPASGLPCGRGRPLRTGPRRRRTRWGRRRRATPPRRRRSPAAASPRGCGSSTTSASMRWSTSSRAKKPRWIPGRPTRCWRAP